MGKLKNSVDFLVTWGRPNEPKPAVKMVDICSAVSKVGTAIEENETSSRVRAMRSKTRQSMDETLVVSDQRLKTIFVQRIRASDSMSQRAIVGVNKQINAKCSMYAFKSCTFIFGSISSKISSHAVGAKNRRLNSMNTKIVSIFAWWDGVRFPMDFLK